MGGAKASEVLIAVCPRSASARPPPRRPQRSDPGLDAWCPSDCGCGAISTLGPRRRLSRPLGQKWGNPGLQALQAGFPWPGVRPARHPPAQPGAAGGGGRRAAHTPGGADGRDFGCPAASSGLWDGLPALRRKTFSSLNCGGVRPHLASNASPRAYLKRLLEPLRWTAVRQPPAAGLQGEGGNDAQS